MKVSIVIPCYNADKTVVETINSVKLQTFKNIEIIVVDDGSTDNTISEINQNFDNIKVLSQDNSGPSAARNYGAKESSGDFLCFIDSDDKIRETFIEECIKEYASNKYLEIVYTDGEFIGIKSGKWKLPKYSKKEILIRNSIPIYALLKRQTFFDVGMFDENLRCYEDWELWLRIIYKYDNCVKKINKTLYQYRKQDIREHVSIIESLDKETADEARLYIYGKHYSLYKSQGFYIENLLDMAKYKIKYYNVWYRKLFYKLLRQSEYKNIYLEFYK